MFEIFLLLPDPGKKMFVMRKLHKDFKKIVTTHEAVNFKCLKKKKFFLNIFIKS